MNFEGKVFSGGEYIETVSGNSMIEIKRKASKICNRYHNVIDELRLYRYCGQDSDLPFGYMKLIRFNRKSPNNRIKRGEWH